MIYNTHAAFGAALMETVLIAEHAPLTWQTGAAVLLAAATAPLPDMDHPQSWVTRHVPLVGITSKFVQHRTLTHSLLLTILLYLVLYQVFPGIPLWVATGFFVGWVSHWLIDLINPMGVRLLYPLNVWVKPPFRLLAIDVNGFGETLVYLILRIYLVLAAVLYVLFVTHPHAKQLAPAIAIAHNFVGTVTVHPIVGALAWLQIKI